MQVPVPLSPRVLRVPPSLVSPHLEKYRRFRVPQSGVGQTRPDQPSFNASQFGSTQQILGCYCDPVGAGQLEPSQPTQYFTIFSLLAVACNGRGSHRSRVWARWVRPREVNYPPTQRRRGAMRLGPNPSWRQGGWMERGEGAVARRHHS